MKKQILKSNISEQVLGPRLCENTLKTELGPNMYLYLNKQLFYILYELEITVVHVFVFDICMVWKYLLIQPNIYIHFFRTKNKA